jgi:hypothetical protein
MAAAVRDPAELLVVLVDKRSRVVMDIADGDARQAVGVAQPRVARAGEHGIDRRAGLAEERPQAMRTPASHHPGRQDRLHDLGPGQPWRAAGSRAAILEAGPALGSAAAFAATAGRPIDAAWLVGAAVETFDEGLHDEDQGVRQINAARREATQ